MISLNERFTEGDCHVLARAIHEITGWPMATFASGKYPVTHAFVAMPDGRYLDIEGVSTREELLAHWKEKEITHWDTVGALRAASSIWVDNPTWPASERIAQKIAKRLVEKHA